MIVQAIGSAVSSVNLVCLEELEAVEEKRDSKQGQLEKLQEELGDLDDS